MNPTTTITIITLVIAFSGQCLAQELPTARQVSRAKEIAAGLAQGANERIATMSPTSTILCHSGFEAGQGYKIEDYEVTWTKLGPETLIARFQHTSGGSELLGALDFLIVFDPASPDGRCYDRVWTPRSKETEQGGAGQPATRPESKSEGGDKPQPESEGRSR